MLSKSSPTRKATNPTHTQQGWERVKDWQKTTHARTELFKFKSEKRGNRVERDDDAVAAAADDDVLSRTIYDINPFNVIWGLYSFTGALILICLHFGVGNIFSLSRSCVTYVQCIHVYSVRFTHALLHRYGILQHYRFTQRMNNHKLQLSH